MSILLLFYCYSHVCHVCYKHAGVFDHLRTCSGCVQKVCKSCSQYRPVFEVDPRTGKPMEERFCKLCISKVVSSPLVATSSSSSHAPLTQARRSLPSDPRRSPMIVNKANASKRENASRSAPSRFLAQSRHIKRPLINLRDTLSSDDESDDDAYE